MIWLTTGLRALGRWMARRLAWHLALKLWGWIVKKIWGKHEQS